LPRNEHRTPTTSTSPPNPPRHPGGSRLLVLGAGPAQLGLLAAARSRGLFVIALDRDPSAPGFAFADRRAIVSTEDERGIERLAHAERVDGVIAPGIDFPVAIAARVARGLGLPHPLSPEAAVLATNKLRQRERLAQAGVPQPSTHVLDAGGATVDLPCVVKAPDRQGQRGLTLVRDRAELAAAIKRARKASRSGHVLVEELVAGPEVTVNAFSIGGRFHPLTVTDRLTAEPPAFGVALAHVWPASHEPVEVARHAAKALGITDGPTYTQLRIEPDGPRVIELAARLGGGHDAELCETALGVDLNGLALAAALGQAVGEPAPTQRVGGACVRFLVAPEGELAAVRGVDEAEAVEGVGWVRIYRRPGHRFGSLRIGSDRAGAVLASGSSREDAMARADDAASRIRFDVVDG
jgi:biotin carboxylase